MRPMPGVVPVARLFNASIGAVASSRGPPPPAFSTLPRSLFAASASQEQQRQPYPVGNAAEVTTTAAATTTAAYTTVYPPSAHDLSSQLQEVLQDADKVVNAEDGEITPLTFSSAETSGVGENNGHDAAAASHEGGGTKHNVKLQQAPDDDDPQYAEAAARAFLDDEAQREALFHAALAERTSNLHGLYGVANQ